MSSVDSGPGRPAAALPFVAEPPGLVLVSGEGVDMQPAPYRSNSGASALDCLTSDSRLPYDTALASCRMQPVSSAGLVQYVSNSSDAASYLSSTEPLQRGDSLTLADVLGFGVAPPAGVATLGVHSFPVSDGATAFLAAHPGSVARSADMLLPQYMPQVHPTTPTSFDSVSAGSMGGLCQDDQMIQLLQHSVAAVPPLSSNYTAASAVADRLLQLPVLTPSTSLPVSSAAQLAPAALAPAERVQLQLLQQQNALLQQQLLQQQQQAQLQQQVLQQQQLHLLSHQQLDSQQQQQQQACVQQQQQQQQACVQLQQRGSLELLVGGVSGMNLGPGGGQLLLVGQHPAQQLLAPAGQQLVIAVQPAGNMALAAVDVPSTNLGAANNLVYQPAGMADSSARPILLATGVPIGTAAMGFSSTTGDHQVAYSMGMQQVAPRAAAAGLASPPVAPTGPTILYQQQGQDVRPGQSGHLSPAGSSMGIQTAGTGVFIRRTSTTESGVPGAEAQPASAVVISVPSTAYGSAPSGSGWMGYKPRLDSPAGSSGLSDRSQSGQYSTRESLDVSAMHAASRSSSMRGSFEAAQPPGRADARLSGVPAAPTGSSRSSHSTEVPVTGRRLLPARPAADQHGVVPHSAPKWASKDWDPRAQLNLQGPAVQQGTNASSFGGSRPVGTGAFIPPDVRAALAADRTESSKDSV